MTPQENYTPGSPDGGIAAGARGIRFALDDSGRVVAIHGVSRSILGKRDEVAEAMGAFLAQIDYGGPAAKPK